MGQLFTNNARTTLGGSGLANTVLAGGTFSVTATKGALFPAPAAGEYFDVTLQDATQIEIIRVSARSSDVFTIQGRAREGGTARTFASGAIVALRLTAGAVESALAHAALATGAHAASAIANTPAGNIVATTVQAALNELDSEKATPAQITTAVSDHVAAADPHTQYATNTELTDGLATKQAADAQLTTLAGITAQQATDLASLSTFMGTVLNDADAATARATLGVVEYNEIQPVGASVAANALTLTLDPTTLDFRSATLTSGAVNTRTVAAAISLVVSSGSTLGTVNDIAARLAVVAIDNAGTVELAVANLSGGVNLDETTLISTTAEGGAGAADSATVIYSTTARTSVPFRVVGFVDITEATAGTWATAPSLVQGVGGQALAAMSSLGYGQKWTDVTASRASGTTYTNTTGRPIACMVNQGSAAVTYDLKAVVGGVEVVSLSNPASSGRNNITVVVPIGTTYSVTSTGATIVSWLELR